MRRGYRLHRLRRRIKELPAMAFQQAFVVPCFRQPGQTYDDLFAQAFAIGYRLVEHWQRGEDWADFCAAAKRHGLGIASVVGHQSLVKGIALRSEHARIREEITVSLAEAQRCGIANLIVLAGNREPGGTDVQYRQQAVALLRSVAPAAEAAGVSLNLEILNTRVDHADYICDRLEWGLDVVRQVNSPKVALLLDLYHRQIMEGDLFRALEEAKGHIGHIHTAGNPGRHELDDQQEINWPAVAKAIADSGYDRVVSHELFPRGDKMAALRQAFAVCGVR